MRQWLITILALAALCTLVACGGGADAPAPDEAGGAESIPALDLPSEEEMNRIVAEVNGQPIKNRRLMEATAFNRFQLQSQGIALTEQQEAELERQVLDLVIAAELMIQDAREDGMSVDPAVVEEAMQEIRNSFETDEGFHSYLAAARLTEDSVRREAERQLLQKQYRESITRDLKVDEKLVRRIYEERKEEFKEGEQVRAAFILIKSSPDDPEGPRAEARKRAEQAYQEIQDGRDFGDVAREYSQVPSAASGGDLGFFKRGDMVPRFEDMAFKTPVGEVTEIFETQFGFNILKVIERKEPRQLSFEEVKPTLSLMVAQRQEADAVKARLAELRAAATIEIPETEVPAAGSEPAAAETPSQG